MLMMLAQTPCKRHRHWAVFLEEVVVYGESAGNLFKAVFNSGHTVCGHVASEGILVSFFWGVDRETKKTLSMNKTPETAMLDCPPLLTEARLQPYFSHNFCICPALRSFQQMKVDSWPCQENAVFQTPSIIVGKRLSKPTLRLQFPFVGYDHFLLWKGSLCLKHWQRGAAFLVLLLVSYGRRQMSL